MFCQFVSVARLCLTSRPRAQYVPDVSALEPAETGIVVDAETRELLKEIGFGNLHLSSAAPSSGRSHHRERAPRQPKQQQA